MVAGADPPAAHAAAPTPARCQVLAVGWSLDGARAIAVDRCGAVATARPAGAWEVAGPQLPQLEVAAVGGGRVAYAWFDEHLAHVAVRDVATASEVYADAAKEPGTAFSAVAPSRDGTLVAVVRATEKVRTLSVVTLAAPPQTLFTATPSERVDGLEFSRDGALLVAFGNASAATVWSVRDGKERGSWHLPSAEQLITQAAFGADGKALFVARYAEPVLTFDAETLRPLAPTELVATFVAATSSVWVYAEDTHPEVQLVAALAGAAPRALGKCPDDGEVRALALAPAGDEVAVACSDRALVLALPAKHAAPSPLP